MYVSDLTNWLENSRFIFADDNKLLNAANSKAIQRYLDKVYQWPVKWDRPLNLVKVPWLMEEEASPTYHVGPPRH